VRRFNTVHQFGALGMIGMIKHCKAFLCCFHSRLLNLELSSMAPCMVFERIILALPIIGTNALFEKKL
jgi:hypothetical protein